MTNELDRSLACLRCRTVPDDDEVEMLSLTQAAWTCQCGMEMVSFWDGDQ